MNFFKKKKKNDDSFTTAPKDFEEVVKKMSKKERINQQEQGQYKIVIKEPMGSANKTVGSFGADRWVDEQGAVWLKNDKMFFKERFPSEDQEYKLYHKEELNKRIKEIELQLSNERKHDDLKVNVRNLEKQLKKYRRFFDSLDKQGKGSFINFDESGKPYFTFVRHDSLKFPVFENIDFGLFHTPSATRIKKGSELIQDRREKYSKHQKMNILASSITLILLVLLCLGSMFLIYKSYDKYSENAAVLLQERIDSAPLYCAELYGKAGDNFYQASVNALNMTKTLNPNMDKKSPDITIKPKETKD